MIVIQTLLRYFSRCGNGIDKPVQPDAGVKAAPCNFFTYQDAALRIIGVITGMDAGCPQN